MLSKNSSVSRRKACRRLSSKSGNRRGSGFAAERLRRCSHCAAKLRHQRVGARIGEHAADLPLEHRAAARSVPRTAASSSGSSGMLLQRKNDSRDASSRSLSRYGVLGGNAGGIALDPEQELRADEQRAQRHLDAVLEPAAFGARLLVEAQQLVHFGRRDRAAVGPSGRALTRSSGRRRPRLVPHAVCS